MSAPTFGRVEAEFRAKRAAGRKLLAPYITGGYPGWQDAIRAAEQLWVTWTEPEPLPDQSQLYALMDWLRQFSGPIIAGGDFTAPARELIRSRGIDLFYVPKDKRWKHLVTFRTRTGGDRLKGLYSFVEDFRRDTKSANDVRREPGAFLFSINYWSITELLDLFPDRAKANG